MDQRLRPVLQGELRPALPQVLAALQRLALFPELGAKKLRSGSYRATVGDIKVLYRLDCQKKWVMVYWIGRRS